MRIHDLRLETNDSGTRVVANISWEDSGRPWGELYFQTTSPFADDLHPSPDAFLVACLPLAGRHGEKRLHVQGAVCPQVRDGLLSVTHTMHRWYGRDHSPVRIEAGNGFRPGKPRTPPRVASMMSGGVDSLTTLRTNRLDYPLDHPASIRDCFCIHGLYSYDFDHTAPQRLTAYWRTIEGLGEVARDTQMTLIPVQTNYRTLDPDFTNWGRQYHGACLAAVGHLFSPRLTRVLIPSSYDLHVDLLPWGSHPLIDPWYAGSALEVRHDGAHWRRVDKMRLLADWDVGLQNIRSCFWIEVQDQRLNCGKCDKCLRTMIELEALEKLGQTRAFPIKKLTPEMIYPGVVRDAHDQAFYAECVDGFVKIGRHDLVEVIKKRLAEYERRTRIWAAEPRWKSRLRAFDNRWLGGSLIRLKEALQR